MVSEKDVAKLLSTYLGEYDAKNDGEYLFYSPFIEHRKKKLQINLDPESEKFGWFQCWVSKKSGKSIFTLLKKADKPKKAFREVNQLLEGEVFASQYTSSSDEERDEEESVELPDEYEPLWKGGNSFFHRSAMEYVIEGRDLTINDIMKYRIGHCSSNRYAGRIIVPSYSENGNLNYFVARDYTGNSDLKYLNPKAPKNTIVFGNRICWDYPVTLVEGVFDAIAARRNAIPLLGKKPSEILRRKLYFEQPPKVYIALDKDALDSAVALAKDLLDEGLDVRILKMEDDRDPGDMGFRVFQNKLRQAEPLDFKSLVSLRLSV